MSDTTCTIGSPLTGFPPWALRNLGLIASLTVLLLVGCNAALPGKPDPKNRPVPPEKVLMFTELYSRNCAGCHGQDGTLGPAPPLNDPLFRALIPVAALEKVLTHGRPGTAMVPFARSQGGPLNAAQLQVLIHEIKGSKYRLIRKAVAGQETVAVVADRNGITPHWGVVPAAPRGIPPYLLPDTRGDQQRGAKLFTQMCANCHGENGKGNATAGETYNRINEPAFLALISDQALRRIMITGRADLGMPSCLEDTMRPADFQGLTATDIADLSALLSSWRTPAASAAK